MRATSVALAFSLLLSAQDGVPPRNRPSDYAVHQQIQSATIAASRVTASQIEKMFSPDVARQYVVLEIAIYPTDSFTVDWNDFALKIGDTVVHPEKPRDVVTPWPEKQTADPNRPKVITETGVVYSRTNDPVNGKRSGWGTYESVGVTNDPRATNPPPAPRQGPDSQIVEQRVREKMLPERQTRAPLAGYLFFPQYAKGKRHPMELQWTDAVTLRIPEK